MHKPPRGPRGLRVLHPPVLLAGGHSWPHPPSSVRQMLPCVRACAPACACASPRARTRARTCLPRGCKRAGRGVLTNASGPPSPGGAAPGKPPGRPTVSCRTGSRRRSNPSGTDPGVFVYICVYFESVRLRKERLCGLSAYLRFLGCLHLVDFQRTLRCGPKGGPPPIKALH